MEIEVDPVNWGLTTLFYCLGKRWQFADDDDADHHYNDDGDNDDGDDGGNDPYCRHSHLVKESRLCLKKSFSVSREATSMMAMRNQ